MNATRPGQEIEAVREFSRFYTKVLGLLRESLLGTPYSLTEARVIFELAQRDATAVGDLRRSLDLDAGYLSRLLTRFDDEGLATRKRSGSDGRRQSVRLSAKGRRVFRSLDERSKQQIAALLSGVSEEDRTRLVGAMSAIRSILGEGPSRPSIVLRPPAPGDLGWIVFRHGALYAAEYGWDDSFEALVARIVADFADGRDARREAAWIAEVDGERVGSVLCTKKGETVAQLRLLLVEPAGRGMGIGSRLVEECLRFARRAGYRRMTLWTNEVLVAARRIYERAGFRLEGEEHHHSFGHDLVGQNWGLEL